MEGVAPQQSQSCVIQSPEGTVTLDRCDGVHGAGWVKTATWREQRGYADLIEFYASDKDSPQDMLYHGVKHLSCSIRAFPVPHTHPRMSVPVEPFSQ